MKEIRELTVKDIEEMNYNELIGLTRETNRTPGGLETIKLVSRLLLLNENTKILDIGTSTGHSALEYSRILNCKVVGVDINEMSLEIARERLGEFQLEKAEFICEDATKMSFEDGTFDVVFAGNVTSLIEDKSKALSEYWRVLTSNGYLVAVPMYYLEDPSEHLITDVRNAIGVNISVYHKEDWLNFFVSDNVEVFEEIDYRFLKCTDAEINNFCNYILQREHLKELNEDAKRILCERYIKYMHLFNENLSHMGYTIFILRKKEDEKYNDPQLYNSERI